MSELKVDLLKEDGMRRGWGSGMSERLTAVTIVMHFYANTPPCFSLSLFSLASLVNHNCALISDIALRFA